MVNITDKEYGILTDYILKNYGIKLGIRKDHLSLEDLVYHTATKFKEARTL